MAARPVPAQGERRVGTDHYAAGQRWKLAGDRECQRGRRPSVPVQLDTGSTGLVIDSTAVGKGAHATGEPYSSGYISGAVNGQIETGAVSIGGLQERLEHRLLCRVVEFRGRQGVGQRPDPGHSWALP